MHRSTAITANLQKNARTADVVAALLVWESGVSLDALADRIVRDNVLGKTTRRRAADLVTRILGRRYFAGGDETPARHIRRFLRSNQPRAVPHLVLYYHTALAEHTLYRIVADYVFAISRGGASRVDRDGVVAFLKRLRASTDGDAYSEAVFERVARSGLTVLRDAGVLEGRAHKRIASAHPPAEVVGYLAYALREEGHSARRIVEHEDWRLLLASPLEAERHIVEASHEGWFGYAAAGDVRRFDWRFASLEEFVDAVA